MKNYIKYQIKSNVFLTVALTVVMTIIYGITCANSVFIRIDDGMAIPRDTPVGTIFAMLAIACYVIPILQFSYKMTKRSTDIFYSLPISKKKLFLSRLISGFVHIIIPFTVAYWVGFVCIACSENNYILGAFVVGYLLGVLFGLTFYVINSFAFFQASNVVDGIVFIAIYSFIFVLPLFYLLNKIDGFTSYIKDYLFVSSPIGAFVFSGNFTNVLAKNNGWFSFSSDATIYLVFILAIVFAITTFLITFYYSTNDKNENVECKSDSIFGYRTLIPILTVLISMPTGAEFDFFIFISILLASLIMAVIYKRTIKIGWKWCAICLVATMLGKIIALI